MSEEQAALDIGMEPGKGKPVQSGFTSCEGCGAITDHGAWCQQCEEAARAALDRWNGKK